MAKSTINPQNLFNTSKRDQRRIPALLALSQNEGATGPERAAAAAQLKKIRDRSRTTTIDPNKVFDRQGEQGGATASSNQSGNQSSTGKKGNPIVNSLANVQEKVLSISNFLSDQAKEKSKAAKERLRNFILNKEAERKKDAESNLEEPEKPIEEKLLNPVERVGQQAQNILQKLVDAFTLIFAGWLTDKGFKLIQAFASNDGKAIRKIGLNLIGPLAALSGVLATMFFGFGAVPLLIAKVASILVTVGGAILGFLLSPPGLITLAIAAGIGAAFLGIKKLNQFLRGGKDAEEARDRNKKKLREAGVMKVVGDRGADVIRDGEKVFVETENLTDEERAAVEAYKLEQQRIRDVTKNRDKELGAAKGKIKGERAEELERLRAEAEVTGDKSKVEAFKKETKRLIKEEKERIRSEAADNYSNPTANVNNISPTGNESNIEKSVNNPNIDQSVDGDNIEVSVNNIENSQGGGSLKDGESTNVPSINSSDDDNMYTAYTQSQIGTTG